MPTVEIYTRATCGYCFRAKRLLDMRGVAYDERPLEGDPAAFDEMVTRAGGRTTVPQIFIDGRHIGGCDDLMELERSGELGALLGQ